MRSRELLLPHQQIVFYFAKDLLKLSIFRIEVIRNLVSVTDIDICTRALSVSVTYDKYTTDVIALMET